MSAELMGKDVTEQAALVRSGEVSALELVDAAIACLESAPELNILVDEQFEEAREAGCWAAAGRPAGGRPVPAQGPR